MCNPAVYDRLVMAQLIAQVVTDARGVERMHEVAPLVRTDFPLG
jgi:hypothetical protein